MLFTTLIGMKTTKTYYIYLLTNYNNRVLYVGVTSNLHQRVHQHKTKFYDGFTKKYNINKLVYYEIFSWIQEAIAREKQIKAYNRSKKNKLVEKFNPNWNELKVIN